MAGTNIETLLGINNKKEVEEVVDFLDDLEQSEKKEFLIFIQGVRFAKGLKGESTVLK